MRCILDSLALAYRRTVRQAAELSGRPIDVVHVVGGGTRNELLCQLTADACGVPVLAGPGEAAAQARTLGADLPDDDMRVALLVTCINDAMFPDTGKAVVRLPSRLGVDVEFPSGQTCCAQPMANTGYLDEAIPVVRSFVFGSAAAAARVAARHDMSSDVLGQLFDFRRCGLVQTPVTPVLLNSFPVGRVHPAGATRDRR